MSSYEMKLCILSMQRWMHMMCTKDGGPERGHGDACAAMVKVKRRRRVGRPPGPAFVQFCLGMAARHAMERMAHIVIWSYDLKSVAARKG